MPDTSPADMSTTIGNKNSTNSGSPYAIHGQVQDGNTITLRYYHLLHCETQYSLTCPVYRSHVCAVSHLVIRAATLMTSGALHNNTLPLHPVWEKMRRNKTHCPVAFHKSAKGKTAATTAGDVESRLWLIMEHEGCESYGFGNKQKRGPNNEVSG